MNTSLFFALYNLTHHSKIFDTLVFIIAGYGDVIMIGVTAAVLVVFFIYDKDWNRRKWIVWIQEVITIGIATTIPWFITFILKIIFHTPRPFVTFVQVRPLLSETPYTSFPSGHATVFFALATVIFLYHKRLGYFFFVAAFLIAISRVIVGVHYPIDILAGAVIGVLIAYFVATLSRYLFLKKRVK